jgi:hypothetical protein
MHAIMPDRFDELIACWASKGLVALAGDETSQQERRAALRRAIDQAGRLPLAPARLLALQDPPPEFKGAFDAMSHGLCDFLVQRKDRATLLAFIADGGQKNWEAALQKHYGIASLRELEDAWLETMAKERPLEAPKPANTLPSTPIQGPMLVPVTLSPDGKFFVFRVWRETPVSVAYYVLEGGEYRPRTTYMTQATQASQRIAVEKGTLSTVDGTVLTAEQIRERLKQETMVVLDTTGSRLTSQYRKLLRDEVLILTGQPLVESPPAPSETKEPPLVPRN